MGEPCQQERNIGEIQATIVGINKTLDRLSVVLEKIAAQGEQIKTLTTEQADVFKRLNQLEVRAAGERVKVGAVVAFISAACSTVVSIIAAKIGK